MAELSIDEVKLRLHDKQIKTYTLGSAPIQMVIATYQTVHANYLGHYSYDGWSVARFDPIKGNEQVQGAGGHEFVALFYAIKNGNYQVFDQLNPVSISFDESVYTEDNIIKRLSVDNDNIR